MMTTKSINIKHVLIVVSVFAGAYIVQLLFHSWPLGTMGIQIDFAAVLLLLFRDVIRDYGYSFRGKPKAQELAEQSGRPFARTIHSYVYAISISLLAAGFYLQLVGNPPDKSIVHVKNLPKGIVFNLDGTYEIDMQKLKESLATLVGNQNSIIDNLDNIKYPEFLVFNCGDEIKKECKCPSDYKRVEYDPKWNLNAKAGGDIITLCYRDTHNKAIQRGQ